uniref:Thaumatin-like protein n=1 Tax=Panagrolaimus davidi TaxID=227884 RepID=A0A914PV72_9BILA
MANVRKILVAIYLIVTIAMARQIKLKNNCQFPVWPGWFGRNDIPNGGGIKLDPGQGYDLNVRDDWDSARMWARTGCDDSFNCETVGCGNEEKCNGRTGESGVTLAEFTLGRDIDHYDVSLVDGFNIQVIIRPNDQGCPTMGECNGDVLGQCPGDLKIEKNGKTVQCNSACTKYNTDETCCRNGHNTLETCPPTDKTKFFKEHCPTSYAYAYDDKAALKTCKPTDYSVSFC